MKLSLMRMIFQEPNYQSQLSSAQFQFFLNGGCHVEELKLVEKENISSQGKLSV